MANFVTNTAMTAAIIEDTKTVSAGIRISVRGEGLARDEVWTDEGPVRVNI